MSDTKQQGQRRGFTPPAGAVPLHNASGETFKWDEPGKVLQGVFIGTKKGSKSMLVIVQTEQGKQAASAPRTLLDSLDGLTPGAKVAIEYVGEDAPKAGFENGLKRFNVWAL